MLALVALDGLSATEAAAALGIRPVTARMALSRARRRMRHLLEATPLPSPFSSPSSSSFLAPLPEVQ